MPSRKKEGSAGQVFAEHLLKQGLVSLEDLEKALRVQETTGRRLEEILSVDFQIPDVQISSLLADSLKVPFLDVSSLQMSSEQLNLLPETLARKHCALPIRKEGRILEVVMADPRDISALQDLAFATGCRIVASLGSRPALMDAIERFYTRHMEGAGALLSAGAEIAADPFSTLAHEASALDAKIEAPVIQLLNLIMRKAIQVGASDIHIEPGMPEGTVRFRLDGLLHDQLKVPGNLHPALVSRLKIIGRMDIAERRLPQDGSVRVALEGREVDLRLSTIPLRGGEKAVIRILDASMGNFELGSIGFLPGDLAKIEKLISRHMGMIIMTGPTGSGKTTTLYAMLNRIKRRTINIVTVEDPIEYNYPGLNQMQVNPEIELSFARGLRSILRQDPDVILVGEIRDAETAEIACRAALTGHLVFSTLHTNDAPSSITRLVDIGVPRYLVSSVVCGIIGQRLVRKACGDCWKPMDPDPESLVPLGLQASSLPEGHYGAGQGCPRCNEIGFKGRMGVFETLVMDARIRDMVLRGASEEDIRLAAQEAGMRTLIEDGLEKARQGSTTLSELGRVLEVGEYAASGCTGCGRVLHHEYRFCPYCKTPHHRVCARCGKALHVGWVACAYCGAE